MTSATRHPAKRFRRFFDPKVRRDMEMAEARQVLDDDATSRQQRRAAERRLRKTQTRKV